MLKIFLSLTSLLLLSGCISTTPIGTVGHERKQLMLLPEIVSNKLQENRVNKMAKPTEHPVYVSAEARFVRVMNTLIPYADEYINSDREVNWRLQIISHKYTNAGAVGKGVIVVSAKLARHPDLKDEHIAALLSHEMAHILRDHNREMDSWRYVGRPLTLGTAFLGAGPIASAMGIFHDAYSTTYSRRMEKEADKIGLDILTKAGYKPESSIGLINVFRETVEKERPILSKLPSILSSHPSFNARIKHIEKNLPELTKQYENHNPSILATNTRRLIDYSKYENAQQKITYLTNKPYFTEVKDGIVIKTSNPDLSIGDKLDKNLNKIEDKISHLETRSIRTNLNTN